MNSGESLPSSILISIFHSCCPCSGLSPPAAASRFSLGSFPLRYFLQVLLVESSRAKPQKRLLSVDQKEKQNHIYARRRLDQKAGSKCDTRASKSCLCLTRQHCTRNVKLNFKKMLFRPHNNACNFLYKQIHENSYSYLFHTVINPAQVFVEQY